MVSIPYRGQEEYARILQEIAPHFEKAYRQVDAGHDEHETVRDEDSERAKKIAVSGTVQMSGIRPLSLEMFKQARTAALPLTEDLYRDRQAEALRCGDIGALLRYPVDSRALEPFSAKQLEELRPLRDFLLATYFR